MRIYCFFIWRNLNPLRPRMLCAKIGWNWLSGSGEDFLISSMCFLHFVIISTWKRAGLFIWTNLNPLHQRMLCVKFCWNRLSGSGEKDFLISSMYFSFFVIISPLKRASSFFWTNLNSLYQRMFLCQVWLKLAQWLWRRKWKCEKFTDGRTNRQTDRLTTDERWSEKLTWAFSSGELTR